MRVLVAPDCFTGTLSAPDAAAAIAAGWRSAAPDDEITVAPLSDGGPGFVDVVAAALGGELLAVTVAGPLGHPVPATLLLTADGTAYLESAQACGLHLIPPDRRDPTRTTTVGVGELIAAALDAGARALVIGLGGSGTNDGGAGALAALGAQPGDLLRGGGAALRELDPAVLDLSAARERLAGVDVRIASDVDSPLLGLRGASAVFGPQKGATDDQVQRLDAALEHFARAAQPDVGLNMTGSLAIAAGAGAAGGLGYGLLLLGAHRVPGIAGVIELTGLTAAAAAVDVIVTGEGCFDWQSLQGKVVSGVAELAMSVARPCVVLAGQVEVGRREMAALGVESAYSVAELAGSAEAAMAEPAVHLEALAARVARAWSRR
ncbi:glycerate kinase [Sporichthya polymorpha]|uniref:glycerate kinase family protein n=1 Tax=Sporichthya polymorpha TaxID=35751 RepID=UPI0003651FC3|nr:glycerate kinase [Sporichthya polymorpha]